MASPRARVIRLSTILLSLLALAAPRARAVEERVWVSLEAGGTFYDVEQALKDGPTFGVQGAGFLNRWVGVQGLWGTASPTLEQPATGDGSFKHFGGGLIVTPDRYRWSLPYLYGGLGSVSVDRSGSSQSFGAYHFGGGVLVRAGERLGFRLDGRDISYKQEGGPGRDTRVNTFQVSGAVTTFWGGRPRDTDEDGVPDKKDKSPDTPKGAVVDATGTPIDTDKDGVFDGIDVSAATPLGAKVDATGTPVDGDKDGVPDGIDTCDSTATGVVVDATGCGVDSDKDGVFDGLDQCADTPTGSMVNATGCPLDADGDGVPDGIDICPATPAGVAVNAGGCPITLSHYENALVRDWLIRLSNIEFPPDSSTLTPQAMARIDSVGAALVQWPSAKVEIGVHVDDQPEPGFRIPLTSIRARNVLQHLFKTYPSLNQKNFWITGYGDTDPIAPNTSAANRAMNRRIDFRLVNMNVVVADLVKRQSYGSTPVPPAPGLEPKAPALEEPGSQEPKAPEPGATPPTTPDQKAPESTNPGK